MHVRCVACIDACCNHPCMAAGYCWSMTSREHAGYDVSDRSTHPKNLVKGNRKNKLRRQYATTIRRTPDRITSGAGGTVGAQAVNVWTRRRGASNGSVVDRSSPAATGGLESRSVRAAAGGRRRSRRPKWASHEWHSSETAAGGKVLFVAMPDASPSLSHQISPCPCWPDRGGAARRYCSCMHASPETPGNNAWLHRRAAAAAAKRQGGGRGGAAAARADALFICMGLGVWPPSWGHACEPPDESLAAPTSPGPAGVVVPSPTRLTCAPWCCLATSDRFLPAPPSLGLSDGGRRAREASRSRSGPALVDVVVRTAFHAWAWA
jgi:hypothetical protein